MNADDEEVEALAALHATTDVMLQDLSAAELELLQEAARKYETVERARIDEVLDGLRTQGRSLREAMALHGAAAEGSRDAGAQTPAARQLSASVARGSAAIVRRSIKHVGMCQAVASRASRAVVDDEELCRAGDRCVARDEGNCSIMFDVVRARRLQHVGR